MIYIFFFTRYDHTLVDHSYGVCEIYVLLQSLFLSDLPVFIKTLEQNFRCPFFLDLSLTPPRFRFHNTIYNNENIVSILGKSLEFIYLKIEKE